MKIILAFAALVAVTSAQYQQYGAPPAQPIRQGGYSQQPEQIRQQGGYDQGPQHTPQVHRHVYVHVAPDEPEDQQARTIRVPGGDKHVNIIFVKTPSSSSSQQTEVILPEQDEHKNLVYVLLKKGEASSDIKIRRPQAARPQKPEVYFIRYKDQEQGGYQQGPQQPPNAPSYGPPQHRAPPPLRTVQPSYGAPF